MRITKYTFEGTPEEFQAAYPLLNADLQDAGKEVMPLQTPTPPTSTPPVAPLYQELTEAAVLSFLTRRNLGEVAIEVIERIRSAGDIGISTSELAKDMNRDAALIKNVMLGFGRRAAHTPGWPDKVAVFDKNWEGNEYRYRLHPVMKSLLDSGRLKL